MNLASIISMAIFKTNFIYPSAYTTKLRLNLFNSWNQFYSASNYEVINQSVFNSNQNDFYMSEKKYYLLNIEVENLNSNAIFIQNKNNINALIEFCKFASVITNVPTQQEDSYGDTTAGAIFFEVGDSNCIINKCTASKCYNNIAPSNYYYDGGQFATFRFVRNQILATSIVYCSDQ